MTYQIALVREDGSVYDNWQTTEFVFNPERCSVDATTPVTFDMEWDVQYTHYQVRATHLSFTPKSHPLGQNPYPAARPLFPKFRRKGLKRSTVTLTDVHFKLIHGEAL